MKRKWLLAISLTLILAMSRDIEDYLPVWSPQ
jgi:hypothetical protein